MSELFDREKSNLQQPFTYGVIPEVHKRDDNWQLTLHGQYECGEIGIEVGRW